MYVMFKAERDKLMSQLGCMHVLVACWNQGSLSLPLASWLCLVDEKGFREETYCCSAVCYIYAYCYNTVWSAQHEPIK